MTTLIFQTLEKLGLTSKKSRTLFSNKTRDVDNLNVWKDSISGVIYIEDFYTGNNTYKDGSYRENKVLSLKTGEPNFERTMDAQRRLKSNLKFIAGKNVADFGCGSGEFIKLARKYCSTVIGVELQQDYIKQLNENHISCVDNLEVIEENSLDVIVSFHTIEHLPNPIQILSELKKKIISGGKIVIEVPHANDFLLSMAKCERFKNFTLWSQHLILHTKESLRKILEFVGLEQIQIKGVQRYPLSNHLNWLANGKSGGHKSHFSVLDSSSLSKAYESSLASIDATDTLVAVAKVK